MHSRNSLLRSAALTIPVSLAAVASSHAATGSPDPQNIVFIFAEDMGLDINPYRSMPFPTPGLDRLAEMGTVFEHAYAAAPTCSPSRASVFTGLQIFRHGQIGLARRGYRMNDDIPMFSDTLKRANYYTAATYKFHFFPEPEFDTGPYNHTKNDMYHKDRVGVNPREVFEVGQAALEQARREDRPWFLYLNCFDTHSTGSRAYRAEHQVIWFNEVDGRPDPQMRPEDMQMLPYMAKGEPTEIHPNVPVNIAAYANAIIRVDHLVEWTLDMLEEKGLIDDTLIIFSSDHGPSWPRGKQMIYNVGVQVPLIVAGPGLPRGERSTALVNLADIMPTIVEAAGETVPADIPAQSLTALLRGEIPPRSYVGAAFIAHWGPGGFFPSYTIRDQRYKLIYNVQPERNRPWREFHEIPFLVYLPERVTDANFETAFRRALRPPEYELYDLSVDPWEFHDLSRDPRYAATLAHMQQALAEWRRAEQDPFLNPELMEQLFALHRRASRAIEGVPVDGQQEILEDIFTPLMAHFR